MLSIVVCSLSSTASIPNEYISNTWSTVMLVRGCMTSMQVEMSLCSPHRPLGKSLQIR